MAGHNKWSQIRHKKAKEDAKRGKEFAKLIQKIIVTAAPADSSHTLKFMKN